MSDFLKGQSGKPEIIGKEDKMRRMISACAAALFATLLASSAIAFTEVKIIAFGIGSNLPIWIAQDKGLPEKEGLKRRSRNNSGNGVRHERS